MPAEVADPDDFYVFKLARSGWALADGHTVEVPASTGNPRGRCYVADAGQPLFCAFRAYMEPETGAGPAYSELIWDRLMVFYKKGGCRLGCKRAFAEKRGMASELDVFP